MKAHTIKYIIKEGFINAYRNKLMSIASLGTVVISLFVLATFLLITINISKVTEGFKSQPEMEVYCNYNLDDAQVKTIEETLKNNPHIKNIKTVTKQEALEKVKQMLGDSQEVLEGIENDFLPVSFIIDLEDPNDGAQMANEFQQIPGVEKIKFDRQDLQRIINLANLIQTTCVILVLMLALTAMFVVSNTIKITVFARRKEIAIMKHIGATDSFIRWPFIVEGIVIGLVGAVICVAAVIPLYNIVASKLSSGIQFIQVVKISELASLLSGLLIGVGVLIGALGSAFSVRKYLRA